MRENRTYGSEGGEVKLPDPYQPVFRYFWCAAPLM